MKGLDIYWKKCERNIKKMGPFIQRNTIFYSRTTFCSTFLLIDIDTIFFTKVKRNLAKGSFRRKYKLIYKSKITWKFLKLSPVYWVSSYYLEDLKSVSELDYFLTSMFLLWFLSNFCAEIQYQILMSAKRSCA